VRAGDGEAVIEIGDGAVAHLPALRRETAVGARTSGTEGFL
jgi:hypothetical protein